MIRNSFVFLDGIRSGKERRLWERGIKDWQDFLRAKAIQGIAPAKKGHFDRRLQEAQQALLDGNSPHFLGKLPAKEMWRLYEHFRDECCFLDIETDQFGRIVLVGISDYYTTKAFVHGANLEKEFLEKELQKYKLVITFNGAAFDLPKLRKQFGVQIAIPHIDLKPLCAKVGLAGGLKDVEIRLNLRRPLELYESPVELWEAFQALEEKEYLDRLIAYNAEDVENLKAVMEHVYKELRNIYKFRSAPSSHADKNESNPLGSAGKS